MIAEGLADGGVYYGVPRQMAYELVAQMMISAGTMMLETKMHPGQLKDNICSPGGTTIRGVRALEDAGVRSAMIDAGGRCQRQRITHLSANRKSGCPFGTAGFFFAASPE